MWLATLLIIIIWTWGLTPLWVNIVVTVFSGIYIWLKLVVEIIKIVKGS